MQFITDAMQHFATGTELLDDTSTPNRAERTAQECEARREFEGCLVALVPVLGEEPPQMALEELHALAANDASHGGSDGGGGGDGGGSGDDEMMRELRLLRSEAHRKCALLLEKGQLGDTWRERQMRMRAAHCHYLRALLVVPTNVEARSGLAALLRLHADGLGTQLAPERALQLCEGALRLILQQNECDPPPWPICEEDEELCQTVRKKLALLLLQRSAGIDASVIPEADQLLYQLGFKVRLAPELLCHQEEAQSEGSGGSGGGSAATTDDNGDNTGSLLRVVDGALSERVIARLRHLFCAAAPFWSQHGYDTLHLHSRGYFSYLHNLTDCTALAADGGDGGDENLMEHVIAAVYALVCERWPHVSKARYAEWWAHCRPHSSGHQMHFDSEDEGHGELRHPIASTVLYISDRVGGPTLVTSQLPGDQHVCTRAYVAFPKANRLVAFDGRRLHGVIPGRGAVRAEAADEGSSHRISVMVAFWADVKRKAQMHEDGTIAASHPWPRPSSSASWRDGFAGPVEGPVLGDHPIDRMPQPVSTLWEPVLDVAASAAANSSKSSFVEGLGWKKKMALPHYEECFAGT